MKILLDQGLPRSLARLLTDAGHPTTHVADRSMATAADQAIIALAVGERAVVITMDADFHALLALGEYRWPSVIRIRQQGLKAENVFDLLNQVFNQLHHELIEGAAVTITPANIRYRKLPIGSSGDA